MCTDQEGSPWLPWFLGCWPSFIAPFKKNKLSCISHLEKTYEANGRLTRVESLMKNAFLQTGPLSDHMPVQYKLNFKGV